MMMMTKKERKKKKERNEENSEEPKITKKKQIETHSYRKKKEGQKQAHQPPGHVHCSPSIAGGPELCHGRLASWSPDGGGRNLLPASRVVVRAWRRARRCWLAGAPRTAARRPLHALDLLLPPTMFCGCAFFFSLLCFHIVIVFFSL